MAPRPQKEEWQWLRGAATNKSKFIFLYEKLSTGWPAPQPPRPIQPEPPEPELQFVFLEPCLVPELAYDTPTPTPTPTPMDDSASLPGGLQDAHSVRPAWHCSRLLLPGRPPPRQGRGAGSAQEAAVSPVRVAHGRRYRDATATPHCRIDHTRP
ncbi:hypothetical protein ZWY2020_049925 [Hordeum vulgare]|nr:hypothetical protein ZWY2020_049925 [Hordeum vulgare]